MTSQAIFSTDRDDRLIEYANICILIELFIIRHILWSSLLDQYKVQKIKINSFYCFFLEIKI